VPAAADIPQQEMIFCDGADPLPSPIEAKAVAALGTCAGAAVASAIYNTTSVRVREYPVTCKISRGKIAGPSPGWG